MVRAEATADSRQRDAKPGHFPNPRNRFEVYSAYHVATARPRAMQAETRRAGGVTVFRLRYCTALFHGVQGSDYCD